MIFQKLKLIRLKTQYKTKKPQFLPKMFEIVKMNMVVLEQKCSKRTNGRNKNVILVE